MLRYYLLSQFRPGEDGDFSTEQVRVVRDSDLADQLGNLVSRVAAMVARYRQARVPEPDSRDASTTLQSVSEGLLEDVDGAMDAFELNRAISRIWELVREANRYVVTEAPWDLAKQTDSAAEAHLSTVLYNLVEALRLIAVFVHPFLPSTGQKIAAVLNLGEGWERLSKGAAKWGGTRSGTAIGSTAPLFPKV